MFIYNCEVKFNFIKSNILIGTKEAKNLVRHRRGGFAMLYFGEYLGPKSHEISHDRPGQFDTLSTAALEAGTVKTLLVYEAYSGHICKK